MIYLKSFNESKFRYNVIIEWEHGDADKRTVESYPFKEDGDMQYFLQFIFDLRNFTPDSGWKNVGHFSHRHNERERKWVNEIDKKYNNKFGSMIPNDIWYKSNDYTPSINSIHTTIDGDPHYIIWEKALKTNIIDIPKIGTEITVSTGHISGHGPSMFGRPGGTNSDDYFDYEDFSHKDMHLPKGEYSDIKAIISDTKIYQYNPYKKYKEYKYENGQEICIGEYYTYHDFTSFQYIQLLKFHPSGLDRYITTSMVGYDPKYGDKFHYPEYGHRDFYLVK